MGFDPRRWRPSSGSRPLTTNVEALLAENESLRRQVRSLRLQLEAFLQGETGYAHTGPQQQDADEAESPASQQRGGPWRSAARSRASRTGWSSAEPARQRVTVGSSHGISADLVERWGRALARHPRWQELRIGPPGGLRGLEEELRRHWWDPALNLEQELDRRSPGLGGELAEALRGPHSRVRSAVRAAFALYGPRAPEWLSEEPLRVVEELLGRIQQLDGQRGTQSGRRARRTANHSGAEGSGAGPQPGAAGASGAQAEGGARQDSHRRSERAASQRPRTPDPRREALALLGLEPGASAAAIKRAYRRLAKAHHPDLGGDVEAFRRLDAAYRSLL